MALVVVLFAGVAAAQPERPPAVEKAKVKFEKEVAKSEETLLTGLDKAVAKATAGKMKVLQESG